VQRPPRSYLIGAATVFVATGAIGFLPLFGGPGYEHALASGLIVPAAAAIATAMDAAKGSSPSPLASVGRGALAGLAYAALALATALLHAARVGICELWGALLYFALTAGVGAVLGGVWGAAAGEAVRVLALRRGVRRVRLAATLLALAAPIGGIVLSLWRFYSSAMIFAFDPFVGFFSGTLYDTVIDPGMALLTYRLGSLATLVACALGASILGRAPDRPFGLVLDLTTTETRARGVLALLASAASVGVVLAGASLGHHSTTESIVRDLGAEKHGARCDVVYPSTTREADANLLVKDCDEEVAAVERALGAAGPPRIRAFFFRDDNDKKRLMGAAHTYIAKPWRKEVYLQMGPYPHAVLGHELAHVIAGSFGQGLFRIAGDAGGYLPNPGLIEGTAVAASPEDDDLTGAQWARAMMQIGILPPIDRVFSLGFLGDASAKSYTLAGAFITWMGKTWGMEAVRRWYGGEDVHAITSKSWRELDAAFRSYLEQVPLPPEAESFARAKFARPGIFGRRCPHTVDALRHEADLCRETQRFDKAVELYGKALEKDPTDFASRFGRGLTERRLGRLRAVIDDRELASLATGQDVPRTWRDRAEEAIADNDFVDALKGGPEAEAMLERSRKRYEALAARSLDEDVARTLEVKKLATSDPSARAAISALLLGDDRHGPDIFVAGVALGRIDGAERSPLASYLIGRNLVQRGFYEQGRATLEAALSGGLPTPRIARETLRQQAIVACALDDHATGAKLKAAVEAPDSPFVGASGGRREATLRLIERCAAPTAPGP
jgi:tetratricopeptide (TPR) repeat protein